MTFQYFFFNTYIGYFLQVLPIAIIVAFIYGLIKYKTKKPILPSCLYVCYLTGLICLVIFIDMIEKCWYKLIYHLDNGSNIILLQFNGNFIPNFWTHINAETIGNILMFIPFGILYYYHKKTVSIKSILLTGLYLILMISRHTLVTLVVS